MKGAEVIFWTAWNGPDPTLDAFRATAETRLRSYFKNEGQIGALEPKDEFRGLLIPEIISSAMTVQNRMTAATTWMICCALMC